MDRDALRKLALEALVRAEQATQGPWRCFNGYKLADYHGGKLACERIGPEAGGGLTTTGGQDIMASKADFEFVAHARSDVPALARAVLALLDEGVA